MDLKEVPDAELVAECEARGLWVGSSPLAILAKMDRVLCTHAAEERKKRMKSPEREPIESGRQKC